MILLIDNYDSFTFNLAQAFGGLGASVTVRRNDQIDLAEARRLQPRAIVLSPGPGRPETAGCCVELARELGPSVPLLGVCLGHQAIGVALGAQVELAPTVVHGKSALISHRGDGLYADLPQPLEVARYHSLVVRRQDLPAALRVEAEADGLIMGMRHREWPVWGVQYHPESIATPQGPALLRNFLRLAGVVAPATDTRRGG